MRAEAHDLVQAQFERRRAQPRRGSLGGLHRIRRQPGPIAHMEQRDMQPLRLQQLAGQAVAAAEILRQRAYAHGRGGIGKQREKPAVGGFGRGGIEQAGLRAHADRMTNGGGL